METCAHCDASLATEWKFCIRCGTRVSTHSALRIPGAIRPDSHMLPGRRRLTPLAIAGIVAGAVLAAAAVVVLAVVIIGNAV